MLCETPKEACLKCGTNVSVTYLREHMVGCNRELVYTCSSFSPKYKSIHVTFQGNNPALIPADYAGPSRSYCTVDSLPHPHAENIAPVYVQSIDIEDDIDLTLSPCSVTSEDLPDLAVLNGEDEEPK